MRRAALIVLAAALLGGCGNAPSKAPSIARVSPPGAFEDSRFSTPGVFVRTPANWRIQKASPPQVVTLSSGAAQVNIWRYPRIEPLPETVAQLRSARNELVKRVQERDREFDVLSTRVVIKPGIRAVEIVGIGTNQGLRRKVRSLHAYGRKGEVVVDSFAPIDQFDRVDKETFGPLARSLKLRRPTAS